MRQGETAITFIALGLGLLLTWFLTFGLLLLAHISQLFSEGKTSASIWPILLSTVLSALILGYVLRLWLKALKATLSPAPGPKIRLKDNTREKLLELAQRKAFTLQEALDNISAHPAQVTHELDSLIETGRLEAFELQKTIHYRLTKMP